MYSPLLTLNRARREQPRASQTDLKAQRLFRCGARLVSDREKAAKTKLADLREVFPDADQVGRVLVFNLRGNAYRLICTIAWKQQTLYVKALLSHAKYDKKERLKWV